MKASVPNSSLNNLIIKIKFSLFNHEPGKRIYFGINTVKNNDYTIGTDTNEKIDAVAEYPISRKRCKQFEQPLDQI